MNLRLHREEWESSQLAPFAQFSKASLGRAIPEKEHAFRTCFQRDRDRIVHSTAFRRLDGKTQVFLNGKGDYYRTRLTHTIEVASISRTIARALGLNEDLTEAIALAHDLGHSPSGHAGEEILSHLMKDHGGFDHNENSLRVVEHLEESYPQYRGLNLSYEVLEGLRKHHHQFFSPQGKAYPSPSLEAQIANSADEIAYYTHDLDDGIEAGLLNIEDLETVSLWQEAKQRAIEEVSAQVGKEAAQTNRKFILRCLTNRQVQELINSSISNISALNIHSTDDVRNYPDVCIKFSESYEKENLALRHFLYERFYGHPNIAKANKEACEKIQALFEHFLTYPQLLGPRFLDRLEQEGKYRVTCDYIAGMTDRYLKNLHAKFCC